MSPQQEEKYHGPLLPQMTRSGPFSVDVPGQTKKDGETIPRRHPQAKDGLITTPADNIKTTYDIVRTSAKKFGNAKAMGSRKLIRTHTETKKIRKMVDGESKEVDKQWTYYELGEFRYISFNEYEKLVLELGSGLRQLGLDKSVKLHIFAATGVPWSSMAHGAASQSITISTSYDTMGEEGLTHALTQTKAKAIFCDPHLLQVLIKPLDKAIDVTHVIYSSEAELEQGGLDKLLAKHPHIKVISYDELRRSGADHPVEPTPPGADDLCCVMYTSGSTGVPKGVPLKHKAVIASIAGISTIVGSFIGPGDSLLAYLPLAHIFEFVVENGFIFWGATMGYGNPKTLSDTSVRHCKGDIREFRPSILVGVPAVWESIRKGIIGKIDSANVLVRNLFWGALAAKSFLMSSHLPGSGILDAVVFNKIKDATGGRLKICMNGGGPVPKETQRFISLAICPMISGYGLTETSASGALNHPFHWTDNAIGDIPASIEIKLVDFPDAGYFSTSTPPQGEVWIRGDPVAESYYENPEETQAAMTSDGWFKTGDIGEFDQNGHLRLIDRKKNLIKTLNGEYIALEKLESLYRTAKVVANICVYAADDQSKPVAIIVPAEPALKQLATAHGISDSEDLTSNTKVNQLVLKELQDAGRKGGLAPFEIIEGVVISDEEWTTANGLLTAATKIQRKPILKKYQKDVDRAYGKK